MKKQPQRTAKTRQALIDSFWELYCEKNIEKITIREITENAGFYRSTFYEYFTDVYAVLHETENSLVTSFSEMLDAFINSHSYSQALENILSFYEVHGKCAAILLGPNGDRTFYKNVKGIIKELLISKLKIPKESIEIDITIEIISSSVISLLNYWYEHKDSLSLREVLTIGSSVFKNGAIPHFRKWGIKLSK